MSDEYNICSRCVMDTTAAEIRFNKEGHCNYCTDFLKKYGNILNQNDKENVVKRKQFIDKIKSNGKRKKYDCIVGVSGGVDSSWTLKLVKDEGLRPLAVHMDNGWNSELATNNIKNLVSRLNVDLYTHVIEWNEYRELMQAFFDADVIDVELLYDNAMLAVNYQQAVKYGVKYILSGTNQATEGLTIPANWNWYKYDKKNIKNIYKKFANGARLKTFPAMGVFFYIYYTFLRGVRWVPMLDYYNYIKEDALVYLEEQLSYKRYPHKHYESVFTRFYQAYILPEKFKIDKRRAHLSNLIMSNQMTREDALIDLQSLPYPSQHDLDDDILYFLKKMRWRPEELEAYLARPEKLHSLYGTEKPIADFTAHIYRKYMLQ